MRLAAGTACNPRSSGRTYQCARRPAWRIVDGDNGLGLVVGPWANALAIVRTAEAARLRWCGERQ